MATKKQGQRRAKGEGTFEQLPSGLWSCYLQTSVNGKRKKVRGLPGETKYQASQNLQKRLAELRKGAALVSARSLTSLGRKLVDAKEAAKSGSPSTWQTERDWLNQLEKDELGRKPVKQIKQADLDSWLFRMRLRYANETVRKRCGFLNSLLKSAGTDLRLTAPAKSQSTRRPMSPGEREIYDNLVPPKEWMKTALLICRYLGVRRSEAFGLKHEDRDRDGIWIRRSVLLLKGELRVRPKGKSAKSHAWVPLPKVLQEIIGGDRKGFVIGGGKDPENPKAFSNWLYEEKQRCGLKDVPKFGAHAVRRTYGMQLLESGVDLITAAEMMRHDPTMLAKEYAASREDLKKAAVEKAFG